MGLRTGRGGQDDAGGKGNGHQYDSERFTAPASGCGQALFIVYPAHRDPILPLLRATLTGILANLAKCGGALEEVASQSSVTLRFGLHLDHPALKGRAKVSPPLRSGAGGDGAGRLTRPCRPDLKLPQLPLAGFRVKDVDRHARPVVWFTFAPGDSPAFGFYSRRKRDL